MKTKQLDPKIKECLQQCLKQAMNNKTFRELFISDYRKAVKELTGQELPTSFKLQIVELEKTADATLILPPFNQEMSDDELGEVVGGFGMSHPYDHTLPTWSGNLLF